MSDQVEEVKQKTDIVSLIGEYITLKKAGRNFKANCPFHNEKTPSLMVSPELQIYKCFGCGETGDVFTFLEKYEGMDFAEALRHLAQKAGVKLETFASGDQGQKERLYKLNGLTSRFYQYFLTSHPLGKKPLDYLLKERSLSLETIKTFQIGYSPEIRGSLKRFLVDKKKFSFKELESSGTVYFKNGDSVDRFRGRIVFTLFDHRGNVVGFSGRILPWVQKTDMAKYINSPETPLYHKSNILFGLNFSKEEVKKQGYVIVTEGELDMISPWQAGFKNIVAIKGSALTQEQAKLLSRFTKRIVLALDSDIAGDMAARRGIVIAQKEGLEIRVARFGEFKDPDEAVRKNSKLFEESIKNAVGVWDYIFATIFEKGEVKSGEGKEKISKELVPVLVSIPDKIVQAHYIKYVADKLNIPSEAVYEQIQSEIEEKKEELPEVEQITKKPEKLRKQLLEERLLTLAFQGKPELILKKEVKKLFSTPLPKRLIEEYLKYSEKHKKFESSKFVEDLPKELLAGYADMALKDLEGLIENEDALKKEISLVIKQLEIVDARHRLEELGVKMRELEEKKEFDKLVKLQEQFRELTNKLSGYEEEAGRGIILQEV